MAKGKLPLLGASVRQEVRLGLVKELTQLLAIVFGVEQACKLLARVEVNRSTELVNLGGGVASMNHLSDGQLPVAVFNVNGILVKLGLRYRHNIFLSKCIFLTYLLSHALFSVTFRAWEMVKFERGENIARLVNRGLCQAVNFKYGGVA